MNKNEIMASIREAMKNEDGDLLPYLLQDVEATMEFITESDDSEFNQLSDYFEDIAAMTQNKNFIECIKSRFIKIRDNSLDLKYISEMIQYAESVFPEEEY